MHHIVTARFIDPEKFIGRTVHTTDGRTGVVVNAWKVRGNVVGFDVEDDKGIFYTDNEHATIVREG